MSLGSSSGLFLILDQTKKVDDTADVWTYRAFEPGMTVGAARVVEGLDHWMIDCKAHTFEAIYSAGFDGAGKRVIELPSMPSRAISTDSAQDYVAKVVCDGVKLPRRTF